jgi:hypothetical protein
MEGNRGFLSKEPRRINNNPDCQEEIELLGNGLRTIGQLIHTSPTINGNSAVWNKLIT